MTRHVFSIIMKNKITSHAIWSDEGDGRVIAGELLTLEKKNAIKVRNPKHDCIRKS